jgi:hypothetical protein
VEMSSGAQSNWLLDLARGSKLSFSYGFPLPVKAPHIEIYDSHTYSLSAVAVYVHCERGGVMNDEQVLLAIHITNGLVYSLVPRHIQIAGSVPGC